MRENVWPNFWQPIVKAHDSQNNFSIRSVYSDTSDLSIIGSVAVRGTIKVSNNYNLKRSLIFLSGFNWPDL